MEFQSTLPQLTRMQPVLRVETSAASSNMQTTRPMTSNALTMQTPTPRVQTSVPRVQPTKAQLLIQPRKLVKCRLKIVSTPISVPHTAQVHNTRSHTNSAANLNVPSAHHTRLAQARVSRIPTPTIRQLTRRMQRVENDVQQEMSVMDKASGKMLNYRQLMRHPNYKGPWSLTQ